MTRAVARARSLGPLALLAAGLVWAPPASAHLPQPQGRLIDLATESDVIVLATVERSQAGARGVETAAHVDRWVLGGGTAEKVEFTAGPRLAPGGRYVIFLHREGDRLVCLQPSGTVFASRPGDDRAYAEAIAAIRAAGRLDADAGTAALGAAMIAALGAPAPALRYHAVLELAALAQHGFAATERRSLERLAAASSTDPALRPVLVTLLAGNRAR